MPRVQKAFDNATTRFSPRRAQWFAEKVRKAHKQGVSHSSIAQALESGQCIFADKCSLPGCERHGIVLAPVSPPAKKSRSVKKNAAALAPTSAPETVPAAAVAAPVGAGLLQQCDIPLLIQQVMQQQIQQYMQQFQFKLPPPGAVAGNVSA
jgi:hypothetical protein